ncbi:MAG: sugar ABC transporter permease [Chloroflexota bacterium]|nr:sugar ABC transporter permease [Chloroflexota bacterium]
MKLTLRQRRTLTAYGLLLVPLAFFLLIRLLPTLSALQVAFYQWDMLSDDRPFVGFGNFQRLASDGVFHAALANTLKYVLLGVPTGLILALVTALALLRIHRLAGFFRTIYFIPFVTSLVAVSWVWRWLYQPQRGTINELLGLVGIPSQPFLQSTSQALPSIVVVNVWHDLGFQVLIFLAGLNAIPHLYYEAARLDGAGRWAVFRHITLPLLNPTIVFLAVTSAISSLQVFSQVQNMSAQATGGPLNSTLSIVLYAYQKAFGGAYQMGYASAMTVVLFVLILVVTVVQLRLLTRRYEY